MRRQGDNATAWVGDAALGPGGPPHQKLGPAIPRLPSAHGELNRKIRVKARPNHMPPGVGGLGGDAGNRSVISPPPAAVSASLPETGTSNDLDGLVALFGYPHALQLKLPVARSMAVQRPSRHWRGSPISRRAAVAAMATERLRPNEGSRQASLF
jgi:hypothetical protein